MSEIEIALTLAEQKLEQIIAREGDADGERRKPYYKIMLAQEILRSRRVSEACMQAFGQSTAYGA